MYGIRLKCYNNHAYNLRVFGNAAVAWYGRVLRGHIYVFVCLIKNNSKIQSR